jgi:dephospho-CoA kinase
MLSVALTGNIAAGKSTVVDHFRRWGATIIDADALAREAQAPGGEVLAAIVRRFGADVLAPDGTLDRAALRGKVMGDQAALDALNSIVHPAVRQRREELSRAAWEGGDVLVVHDIPLLFEVLDPTQFDVVVLVDASVALRRTRLRGMRGLSIGDADRMIAAQMPAERKRARSHFTIDNDGARAPSPRGIRGAPPPRGGGGARLAGAQPAGGRPRCERRPRARGDWRALRGCGPDGASPGGRGGGDRAHAQPAGRGPRRHRRDASGSRRHRGSVGARRAAGRARVALG